MTAISGAFYSQFPLTGSLGLSLASIQGGTSTASNAAAINASAVSSEGGAFGILSSNQATTTTSPTIQALTTGQMTNGDHKVLASIGGTASDSLDIPWNANGTEPTEVSKLKQQGWIKLVKVAGTGSTGKPSGATYTLTPVGQAIYKRTVSSTLGASAAATAATVSSAAASSLDSNLQSEVSTLLGGLSSVGVDVSV
jgi:hypothetical protein